MLKYLHTMKNHSIFAVLNKNSKNGRRINNESRTHRIRMGTYPSY
nr:MAG TPA: hypothetical protein [Caudoviricetes sp.]